MLETRIPGSLFLPFRWTLPFYWLHRSYHFNSSRPFDTSFFLISTRPSRSCTSSFRFKPFMWLRPFIRVNSYTLLSFTCLFYCNSSMPFVTSFLSFQFLPSVCGQVVRFLTSVLTFHLVYTPHSLLFPFRLTSYSPFVTWTLSLHLSPFIRCTSFLSFKLFPSVRPFLSFQLFPFIRFFKFCGLEQSGLVSAIQAATFSRDPLRPLAPAATCGHLRPLATTCGHLRPLAATCSNSPLRPLAATCDHLHSNGCKRLQEAASGIVFVFCNLNETLGF